MPLECREMEETFIHAYVDGEFSSEETAEVKAHLLGCAACSHAVRIQQSYKSAAERANLPAPHALHDAVRESIAREPLASGRWGRALRDPRAVGIAAAAIGAAAWFLAGGLHHPLWRSSRTLVDDGVALHARALPLDYTASDVSSAQRWLAGKLDFGVRLPRFAPGPRMEGVRLSQVRSRQAAVITYTVPAANDRRVSLLIVDDPEPQLPGAARRIADREIWLSRARGFNIASWRNDEIVYSLISDLDEQDVLALVQSADLH